LDLCAICGAHSSERAGRHESRRVLRMPQRHSRSLLLVRSIEPAISRSKGQSAN
jgi:hypothetical protein